jgi:hypothetical protein
MQNREIIRYLVAGLMCMVGLLFLGFGPLLFAGKDAWAASIKSNIAMPIGESKQAETTVPFEQKQPGYDGAAFIKQRLGR